MIGVEFGFKLVMGSEPHLIVIMVRFERVESKMSEIRTVTDEGERNPRHKDSDIVATRGARTPVCATEAQCILSNIMQWTSPSSGEEEEDKT